MGAEKTFQILVADDSPTVRQLIGMMLKKNPSFQVTEARDGQEALEEFGAGRFDLLVTDVNMPRLDGLGLIEAVRGRMSSPVPIIVVTTQGGEEKRDRGMALGASAYLTKPFDGKTLMHLVERTLVGAG
jgi:two-component system chemotaxis response regulator CheY